MPKTEDNFEDGKKDTNSDAGNFVPIDTSGGNADDQKKAAKFMGVDINADDSSDESKLDKDEEDEFQYDDSKSDKSDDDTSEDDESEEEEGLTFSTLDDKDDESEEEEEDDKSKDDKDDESKKDEEEPNPEPKPDETKDTGDDKELSATDKLVKMQHEAFAKHVEIHKDFYPADVISDYQKFQKVGGDAGKVFIVQNEHLNKLDDALQKISSSLPFTERFELAFKIAFPSALTKTKEEQIKKSAQAQTELKIKQANKTVGQGGSSSEKKTSKFSDEQNKMAKRMGISLE